jgi:large repetitive protein
MRRTVLTLALTLCATSLHAQSFTSSGTSGISLTYPTSLQFGPDHRLYVSEQAGLIKAYTMQRSASGTYSASASETISLVRAITNHNDDGGACSAGCGLRQVTGLLVTGTAATPVLYVSSSDSRIAVNEDSGLDTNSGVVSRLTCSGGLSGGVCQGWQRVDIVRGLPRSEENHAVNGMALDAASNTLYLMVGGNANMGAPASAFSGTPEYYLAGALLAIDLAAIAALEAANGGPYVDARDGALFVYDMLTLDDPTRPNITHAHAAFPYPPGHPRRDKAIDLGDPWGGNNGLNQAIPEPGSPVRIHSPGYRNAYDVVFTRSGELYTFDNGPNSGWGGTPFVYTAAGVRKGYIGQSGVSFDAAAGDWCSNEFNESGSRTIGDPLKRISAAGYYGGHPAPIRAFPGKAGIRVYVKNSGGGWEQSGPTHDFMALLPAGYGVSAANFPDDPRQCNYTLETGALEIVANSTNGITEYTAGNFGGAMSGDLLAASFTGNVYRCKPDGSGGLVDLPGSTSGLGIGHCEVLFGGLGAIPLDVTAVGDEGPFPGTVWVAQYLGNNITVFEPADFGPCDPSDPAGDADGDGYSNADEADNGTDPCNAGSIPSDFDGDFISDLNDPDDDNDGIADVDDAFALDATNGRGTAIPLHYPLFNNNPGTGLFGLGFTGLMLPKNGSDTWLELFDPDQLAAGGAVGRLTVEQVTAGDASSNNARNGFQFGVDVDNTTLPFRVQARLVPPYFEQGGSTTTPVAGEAYGLFIGTGDQDNYLRIVLNGSGGSGGVAVGMESPGSTFNNQYLSNAWGGQNILAAPTVDLYLDVHPQHLIAQARVSLDGGTTLHPLGTPRPLPAAWFDPAKASGLAVGLSSTSSGGPSFGATWDLIDIAHASFDSSDGGSWSEVAAFGEVRHEHAFVQAGNHFLLLGGRESLQVRRYDIGSGSWSNGAAAPIKLHHFQAETVDGLVYVLGAMTGECCAEPPAPNVYIYDPLADRWHTGPEIPQARRRGGGGAVAVGRQLYLVSGNTNGHYGPVSALVDRYDPASATFTALAPIPNPRDHFFVHHHAGKLYAASGRDSNAAEDGNVFDDTIAAVDVYDIAGNSWSTLPSGSNMPTPRAGAASGIIGNTLVVAGGESSAQTSAHGHVHGLDLASLAWRPLTAMRSARHGGQAIVSNDGLYVVAGSANRGGPGSTPLPLEALHLAAQTSPTGSTISAGTLGAPASLAFGAVAVGASSVLQATITNSGGNQGLVIDGFAVSGSAFALEQPSQPRVVPPGGSVQVAVRYAPTAAGEHAGTLTVQRVGAVLQVALSGSTAATSNLVFHDGFE